ncbi:Dolichyl-diphosphooligosaccharide-protein glycosyltransferase subunit dad1 [Coemansia sp. RSA 455]|nr:Dolichyl-diphosphooligosaccharide-protein glycosyltransferase subunit dad1 [Coemansia sp. S680]KAJ2039402.1 Dolichyl-diphosphooligosaccharide-protein glycosyltransferase subunit dad1 [Coemansia sp. S3946]KAJ2066791.1 Dolichyl-diphosphooligosaccharide-protein glycosyltransferase subunit dad1 [Coemansia sp. S2]KAJ2106072.1 Dolichyl-diphosphooligosaccharide-protein glycosyltransferase subunit dad1 [Coemansia sp. RSA 922]KAJ2245320.1 Dolichyl-diphosphooligosaccharide-protein glycosyltransferase 
MDRTDAHTASYAPRPQYEREKERLIVEINQGMDIVNRNLLQLNQNLESAISLGSNFGRIASLWSEFGTIINPPMEEDGGPAGNSSPNVGNEEDNMSGDDAYVGNAGNKAGEAQGNGHDYELGDDDDDHPGFEYESMMDEGV